MIIISNLKLAASCAFCTVHCSVFSVHTCTRALCRYFFFGMRRMVCTLIILLSSTFIFGVNMMRLPHYWLLLVAGFHTTNILIFNFNFSTYAYHVQILFIWYLDMKSRCHISNDFIISKFHKMWLLLKIS